ncbi:MAG: M23 family metallopeptidase [Candidatus Rokubacteria bacterium]|nr:M23 family metallopeptidase [Candidatus Rokubacteria bacterium]MBI3827712.1 M23 family metallopeptidase [Candidatus Rokubacteria bacterium]
MRALARVGRRRSAVVLGLAVVLAATPSAPAKSRTATPSVPDQGERDTAAGVRVHTVRAGDTLGALARHYGVTVAAIQSANRLKPGALLRIGQRLLIPGGAEAAARVPPDASSLAAQRPPAPPLVSQIVLAVPSFGDLIPLFTWPVEGPISSAFGRRRSAWHRGIDIKAERGIPVLASTGGFVVASGFERRYGRVVKIEHAGGFLSVYAHNDENFVEVGDRVVSGQEIGVVGRTGRATAHHLHFEIRQSGLAYNPLYLLPMPPRTSHVEEMDTDEPEDD